MSESAGEITYTVDMETSELLKSTEKTDAALDGLQKGFDKTDKAAKGAEGSSKKLSTEQTKLSSAIKKANGSIDSQSNSFNRLIKIAAGYMTLQLLKNAMELADQYTDMASRIRNVTVSTEEYEMVQARLLQTANGTYRALNEAQEVYLSTADTLKDLGYNTAQVLDITDSMSYAFVRDAARADQATNAMDAYSKSLMKGKIDADAWASILAATPSIVQAVAQATGETTTEIRKLGATGKLSVEALTEGFRQSVDINKEFAANMDATGRDAFIALQNSLQVFIGKVNESSGATDGLVSAVGRLSETLQDPDTIEAAQNLASAVVNAFDRTVEGTKNVVKFTKWMGEEMAASFGGINTDDIVRLEQRLDHLQSQASKGFMDKDLTLMFTSDDSIDAEISDLQAKIEAYYKAQEQSAASASASIKDNTETTNANTESKNNNISATNQQAETDKKAEQASKLLAKAQDQNAGVLSELSDEMKLAKLSGLELAQASALLKLNEYATPAQIQQVKDLTAALYEQEQKLKDTAMVKQLDPAVSAQSDFDTKLENLRRLNEAKLIEDQRYLELKTQLETAHTETMRQIEEQRFAAQSRTNQLLIDSLNEVQQAGTEAITGLLTGTNNLTDAMQQLGAGILRHAVGGLVEMGIQYVKSMIMGQTAQTAAAATAAATGSAMASAYAPAAAMASLASFGANAAPASAGIASTVGVAQALSATGGRLYGGPVSADGMYRINENGKPEVFNAANGQQYMLPNSRGEVISNKNATSGGGGVVNNITITVADGAVQTSQTGNNTADSMALANGIKAVVVDEMERQARPGGILWRMQNA